MRQKLNDRGLTLIETLVTLAILASIAGVLVSFQWMTLTQWRSGDNQAELQQSLRLGLSQMTRITRLAQHVEKVGGMLEIYYKEPNHEVGSNTVVQKRTRFYVQGTVLYMETEVKLNNLPWDWGRAGKNQVALHITSLTQEWNSSRKYADYRLGGKMADGQTYTLQTRMTPRLMDR